MPTRAIALLMFVGFLDLVATAVLHAKGLITELNPLMKPLIEHSEWTFAFVKGLTLVVAWYVMARHAHKNLVFVRRAALTGAIAYIIVWVVWFTAAHV
ncbi:MAG: DUF5658 family protein [Fimbriimonadaceae bacterium]|nr:DUF5658 family protein [Fimbriimonadaceae bacterium]